MNVCTIIAKNYLAPARVLARSLRQTNPGSRLWVLIVDDFDGYVDPTQEPFSVLTPADVGCDPFVHMALRYSVLELSTAVKPWLLAHLMRETGEPVTYLDPDIEVYASLQPLEDLVRSHGVVLTPHTLGPIPQDGRTPSQVDVMIAGIYNLGYVSLAPGSEVDGLIDWWADRLRRDCRVDPLWGYFVDQRWFDLAPGFLSDITILREPGYNVAYWNIHERRLRRDGDRWLVDDQPLRFFHFSGFDPARPLVLSRHQSRTDVTVHPELEELLAGYAALVQAEGHARSRDWPYGLARLGDGSEPDDELRASFDAYATEHGEEVPSPFTASGMAAFDRWLTAQAPGEPAGVTRAMAQVYRDRADVRGAFPDLRGADARPFREWATGLGAEQEPTLARVQAPGGNPAAADSLGPGPGAAPTATAPEQPLRDGPWGFNLLLDDGPDSETAALANQIVDALDAHGVPLALLRPGQLPVYVVTLVPARPERLARRIGELGPQAQAGRFTVAVCAHLAQQPPPGLAEELWVVGDGEVASPGGDPPRHPIDPRDTAEFARFAERRLEAIAATGRAYHAADPIRSRPPSLARLPLRLRQGPFPAAAGAGQVTRERLRQAVLRVIRPFTAFQEAVNDDVVSALTELSSEVIAHGEEVAVERATGAAQRRRDSLMLQRQDAIEGRLGEIEALLRRLADGRPED